MMTTDQGQAFGTWDDETSRLIYGAAMPALLVGTDTGGTTLDLGGGPGLARPYFRHLTTVDNNPDMKPDVLADLRSYEPNQYYSRVLLRYVLHYLDDTEVADLMAHLASWHTGQLTVIQFVTVDLTAKLVNSVNETKYFRTEEQLVALLGPWRVVHRVAVEYDVVPEFYANRLHHPNPIGHREQVVAVDCELGG